MVHDNLNTHTGAVQKVSATARDLVRRFDQAIVAEDAEAMASTFCIDGQLLLDRRAPLSGRAAIAEAWRSIFAVNRTVEYVAAYQTLDERADRAYAFATYVETAESRETGQRRRMTGRAVYFARREAAGTWCLSLALNSLVSVEEERTDAGVDELREGASE